MSDLPCDCPQCHINRWRDRAEAAESRAAELEAVLSLSRRDREDVVHAARMLMESVKVDRARLAKLEADRRWIPVGERLPDVDTLALAVDVSGTVDVVRYHGQHWSPDVRDTLPYWGGWDDITHWRPLPSGPEVQP